MRKFLIPLFLLATPALAQDISSARKTLEILTSKTMWGRGYTQNGMAKAASYLCERFQQAGLQALSGTDFRQSFSYPVNTFPGKMELFINNKRLVPGKDFIVSPSSTGKKASGILQQKDSVTYISAAERIVVQLEDKLTWSVAQEAEDYTGLQVDKKALTEVPASIRIDIENVMIPRFGASNICGIVKGTKHPDSILLFTAHYDHLGGMGDQTFFPGANDNGSGVSLLLSLAAYYGKHPQPYSMAFICFAGEEAGILGSKYFTEHPLIPLDHIKFMVNVDMVGTGETGITVVNSTLYPEAFALLNKINDQKKYLPKINPRGKAANSDHYFFTEKGVPAFFIYTQGGIAAYHDINDLSSTLPLTEFEDLYHLILDFNQGFMHRK
ncbi:M28 family metallopeptidase [Pedobacter sp. AW31-3R]|uniref:M28 family metallopeptidase n=1 Tax=Pedobacter sp. AW31-3R TaxID=3445781 RepID=UPI003FA0D977